MKKVIFLLVLAMVLAGCATRSYNFVGVHFIGQQSRAYGEVAKTAVEPVNNFIKEWLGFWENNQFEQCHKLLSEKIQNELSVKKLEVIKDDLIRKYGKTQKTEILEIPQTRFFPMVDEALFKKTPQEALRYYNYVLARYINYRSKLNIVYFIGVGLRDKTFEIVTLGMGEETSDPTKEPEYLYWYGYPSF